jgi:glycosyltransferase involved in cell wall biosynthesis
MLVISDLGYGGAERQVVALANGLAGHGIEAFVATLSGHTPLGTSLTDANRLYVVGRSPFRLARLLKELRIDVVHGFLLDAEIVSRLAARITGGIRVIGSERSTRHHYAWWQTGLYKITGRGMSLCIANTSEGAHWHSQAFGFPPNLYRIVRNGVDTDRFSPGEGLETRHKLGVSSAEVLIGMFANFKPVKNHTLLIEALALLNKRGLPCKALLVGDQMQRGRHANTGLISTIETQIRDLRLESQVIMVGHQVDIEHLYRACTLTVLPSDYEGTPNVVIESMACGIPAVVSDVPGNREVIVAGEGGLLFSPGSPTSLADVLEGLLKDAARLESMRSSARVVSINRFGMSRMLEEMASAYRSLF